jgi:hypothetical protein
LTRSVVVFVKAGILRRWKLDLIAVTSNLDGGIHRSVNAVCVLGCGDYELGRVLCRDRLTVDDEEKSIKRENSDLG